MFTKFFKVLIVGVMSISVLTANYTDVSAETSGFTNPEFIELLDQIIESETNYGLTGVQLAVYKDGALIKNSAYGSTNNYYNVYDQTGASILDQAKALPKEDRNPVQTDTLFDMASNTKMYATVYAMQKLVSENKIQMDQTIASIYPEFTLVGNENGWKDIITVEHVLSHSAGFAPDPQYHNNNYDEDDGIPNGVNDLYSQDKETTFEMIMKTPVTTEPGTKWAYSDVDMMLAGFIVETKTGKDLDTYVKESFYQPLGLDKITFNPLNFGFTANQTSSSELHGNTRDGRITFNNVRTEVVTGQVHDEKAFYSMDGVSGHAGLFGTAQQVAFLAQAMFDGTLNGQELFDQDTIDKFTETSPILATQTAGGWRRKSETGGAAGWFSKFAPAGTIGHTGWTGTNTMIDTENNLTLALFTNSRNTPIMGPGANTFYTANSNISTYGTVSEFIYRGLGEGTETAHEILEAMVLGEIPADLASQTMAKRNVVRSLIDVVALRAETDTEAKALLESQTVQDALEGLKAFEAEDLKFLTVTKHLDDKLDTLTNIDKSLYTTETVEALESTTSAVQALLAGNYTQADIDNALADLVLAESNLEEAPVVPTVNKAALKEAIDAAKALDRSLYTEHALKDLDAGLDSAMAIYTDVNATQAQVDQAITDLQAVVKNLELKKAEPKPTPEEDNSNKTPGTGLNNNTTMFSLLLVVSLGGLLALTVLKKKKSNI